MGLRKSILAGIAISIGATAYLNTESPVVGAILFGMGSLIIYVFNLDLFTGRCCFVPLRTLGYFVSVIISLLGNFIGVLIFAYFVRASESHLVLRATEIITAKMYVSNLHAFVFSIPCGIILSVPVWASRKQSDEISKYVLFVFAVATFIIGGFEHSIANIYYIALSDIWTAEIWVFIFLYCSGNLVGSSLMGHFIRRHERD